MRRRRRRSAAGNVPGGATGATAPVSGTTRSTAPSWAKANTDPSSGCGTSPRTGVPSSIGARVGFRVAASRTSSDGLVDVVDVDPVARRAEGRDDGAGELALRDEPPRGRLPQPEGAPVAPAQQPARVGRPDVDTCRASCLGLLAVSRPGLVVDEPHPAAPLPHEGAPVGSRAWTRCSPRRRRPSRPRTARARRSGPTTSRIRPAL